MIRWSESNYLIASYTLDDSAPKLASARNGGSNIPSGAMPLFIGAAAPIQSQPVAEVRAVFWAACIPFASSGVRNNEQD